MMPKGVEHLPKGDKLMNAVYVPTSLMPKGVEHIAIKSAAEIAEIGANLIDAERR